MLLPHLSLGIDPGFSGALALVGRGGILEGFSDAPVVKFRGKKHLDVPGLVAWLRPWVGRIGVAVLEWPGPRPKEGVSSVFRFGRTVGELHGALVGVGIPVLKLDPAVWKCSMNVTSDKRMCCRRAAQLFPGSSGIFEGPRKGLKDGRAEAALLGWLGLNWLPSQAKTITIWD